MQAEKHIKNSVETIGDKNGILWSSQKHIQEGLDHINLWEITIKCYSDHIKHRYELVNETKSNPKELL